MGECVTVTVNTEQSQIIFTVDGQIRHTYVDERIKDRTIKWVPWIRLWKKNECIKIV